MVGELWLFSSTLPLSFPLIAFLLWKCRVYGWIKQQAALEFFGLTILSPYDRVTPLWKTLAKTPSANWVIQGSPEWHTRSPWQPLSTSPVSSLTDTLSFSHPRPLPFPEHARLCCSSMSLLLLICPEHTPLPTYPRPLARLRKWIIS